VRLAGLLERRRTCTGVRERIRSSSGGLRRACDNKSQFRSLIETVHGHGVCGPRTVSLRKAIGDLLPGHSQVQPFLRGDEVIVDVLAQIDLHPVDLPVKFAGLASVV